MECLRKPIWNKYTREELTQLAIQKPGEDYRKRVKENWDRVAKPLDSMGRFEALTAQIGAITGTEHIDIVQKAVVIFCADNGIVEEGVTQSGQEVTYLVAKSMGEKKSSVCKMAQSIGAETIPVDIGIHCDDGISGVLQRKIRRGTRNFLKEPAMTEEEAIRAIATGIELVEDCKKKGFTILATGEMGIGNTTTSSAMTAALTGREVSKVTGRGAGLSNQGFLRKQQVIAEAIGKYALYDADALTVLATVGGLDIAGMVGLCIGGALYHIPIVLDGVISMVAALAAERILPGTKAYLLPSHKGKEPAMEILAEILELEPVIDAGLALGEGTGAVMLFTMLDMALSIYTQRTDFMDINVKQYERFR